MKLLVSLAVLVYSLKAPPASAQAVAVGEPGALGVIVTLPLAETEVLPGGVFPFPVRFEMPEGVHLYWLNPGEAGMPPRVDVEAPEGWAAGEPDGLLMFPPPIRFESAGIVGFGYEDELLVSAAGALAAEPSVGSRGVAAVRVRYLACDADRCVPGEVRTAIGVVQPEHPTHPEQPFQNRIVAGYGDGVAEQVVRDGFLPLPGVPEGATEVEFFPFPRAFLELSADGALGRAVGGAPEVERSDAGAWRVSVGDPLDPAGADGVFRTGGLVGFTLDGRREAYAVFGRGS